MLGILPDLQRKGIRFPKKYPIYGAPKGVDGKNLPILTDPKYCKWMENFIARGEGRLEKRKGRRKALEITGWDELKMKPRKLNDTYKIVAGSKNNVGVGAYWHLATGNVIEFKDDFSQNGEFSSDEYGDVVYMCNGGDKIGYVNGEMALGYDDLTGGSFAAGNTITGSTSGITATIKSDAGGNTLTLTDFTGNFEDDELITEYDTNGTATGVTADVDGILKTGWNELTNAPKAKVLFVHNARLYAGNIDPYDAVSKIWEVQYSEQDDGTGVAFTTWTAGTDPASPGAVRYRNAGGVKDIGNVGDQIVALYDLGKMGFHINILDVATSGLQHTVQFDFQKVDFGSQTAISTTAGIYYSNQFGIYFMKGGQNNVVNEVKISEILGNEIFRELNFENGAIGYSPTEDWILFSCAYKSDENNLVLIYDIELEAWMPITGWNIAYFDFDQKENILYGVDTNEASVYELFYGYDDDGEKIWCKYHSVEFVFNDEQTVKDMNDLYVDGLLADESVVKIYTDKWDRDGYYFESANIATWSANSVSSGYLLGAGREPAGRLTDSDHSIWNENKGHLYIMIEQFTKCRFRIEENSFLPLEIRQIVPAGVRAVNVVDTNNITSSRFS